MVSKLNKKLIISVILLVLFLTSPNDYAATTGKIAGKVVSAETQKPLPGANVIIEGTNMGAATDVEGDYYILNVTPGCYNIKATMMGYKAVIKIDVNVSIDHTTLVNFQLEETVIDVGESVMVVAHRPPVEVDKTSSRHVVESQEIASRPIAQLSDMLTSIPGIDYNAGGELTVRMGTLDEVSFLIDGMRARNPLNSQPYFNINLMAIQELEVITGGYDAEYGEAQSGVFNIITKEGTDHYMGSLEMRWTPPGLYHWGTALYDYSTDRYWENTHARHLQWWIDYPDMWVDFEGRKGNDPDCSMTPEEAYQNYMKTHQPLTDYTNRSGYQAEFALGGPILIDNLSFFISGRYRTAPPISGISYLNMGNWIDGTAKLIYKIGSNKKLMFSSFWNVNKTCYGMEWMQLEGGYSNKYAYNDFEGYPQQRTNGQILKFVHNLSQNTYYELRFSRVFDYESQGFFPEEDTVDWNETDITKDLLRAYDSTGTNITNAYNNVYGLHTRGYFYVSEDFNTDWTLAGKITSQLTKKWQMRSGFGFTYYVFDRYQEARSWETIEDQIYRPYEGNLWWSNKLEFEGLIMNLGLRLDFYNPNDVIYMDIYDPFDEIAASKEGRKPVPETKPTYLFGQLSPRIGISHPITEKSVLHFNYGHFFQRASFGEYGEGENTYSILSTYVTDPEFGSKEPRNLGNRELRPRRTISCELGIEQDFDVMIADVNAFYKDKTNEVRSVTVIMANNEQYKTSGNSNYGDAKGVEISLRRPMRGYWGGYMTYTWSTGIKGYSGDPYVLYPPGAIVQASQEYAVGDYIEYMRPNISANLTLAVPSDFSFLWGAFSNIQFAMDYYISFPNVQINSDIYQGVVNIVRPPNKQARIRIRKELKVKQGLRAAFFVEMENAFNDKWHNTSLMEGDILPEDEIRYINSNLQTYPRKTPDGSPFPNYAKYTNLPRKISFGIALSFE